MNVNQLRLSTSPEMETGVLPTLSIIICTRNRANSLHGTLASLARMKTDISWEAILVDNASTDDTMQVLQSFAAQDSRIRVLRVDRVGVGAARDAAWRQARGDIISFTDDDCYVAGDYVDRVVEVFREHPEVGCVGGQIRLYDPTDARITIDERDSACQWAPCRFLMAGEFHGANLSFRAKALWHSGGFDPELGAGTPFPCEDADAVAALLWAGFAARYDPRPVVLHHHGRKISERDRIMAAYDRGRGAYYAKYILRLDSRRACMKAWWQHAHAFYYVSTLGRLRREVQAAASYMLFKQRYGILLAAVPVWLVNFAAIAVGVCLRYAGSRLRRSARG